MVVESVEIEDDNLDGDGAGDVPTFDPAPVSGTDSTQYVALNGQAAITATGVSADTATIQLVERTSSVVLAETTSAPWTLTWDTVANPAGNPRIIVTDRAGNYSTMATDYYSDNRGPYILGITYPFTQGYVSNGTTLDE
ncbi:hypothetical protein [Actinoplanes sp. NPDC051851]|uniref:hypothetical protein n=1 Tax=Actinoplanes sp. NPDC051851 TaxID=3154753 RepID=UPI00343DD411